jgi:hypothetical protein
MVSLLKMLKNLKKQYNCDKDFPTYLLHKRVFFKFILDLTEQKEITYGRQT